MLKCMLYSQDYRDGYNNYNIARAEQYVPFKIFYIFTWLIEGSNQFKINRRTKVGSYEKFRKKQCSLIKVLLESYLENS